MTSPTPEAGLHLDQAPPLAIPLSFFLTAPLFIFAAGVLLCWAGASVVLSRYLPITIAFTHLGTLGVLAMVMFGALYQMTPVVAASPIPCMRLAHLVHAGLCVGAISLGLGLIAGGRLTFYVAFGALGIAWLGFVVPVGIALWRAHGEGQATVQGMRLAMLCLLLVGAMGLWMAHGHAGMHFPGPRPLWMAVHLGLALLGWVGGLITALSWQVVPMFYLTPPIADSYKRGILLGLATSVLLAASSLAAAAVSGTQDALDSQAWSRWVFLPAALAVWVVHPLLTLRTLAQRKRRRADATRRFWIAGLWLGVLCFPLGAACVLGDDPRLALAFGFVATWGWAAVIVHGMLYRIVPFLVWFHRISHLVGYVPVPSAGKLLPERWPSFAFGSHLLALVSGLCAIALRSALCVRLTGVLLMATALQLGWSLVHVARYQPPAVPKSE